MGKTYDNKGNLTSITDPDGNVSYTEYNELGKKSAEIDKMGNRKEFIYDDRGNQTETIYPDSTREIATFDVNGNLTSSTNVNYEQMSTGTHPGINYHLIQQCIYSLFYKMD
jgi:YD repeat-containing protein